MSVTPIVVVRGTGSIGSRHLAVFRDMLKLNPIAVPVRSERIAGLTAAGFQANTTLDTHRDAPCACVVATDTDRHLQDAEEALRRGYSLLIEKPVSHSTEGLRHLKDLAGTVRLPVFVGCTLRFHKGLRIFRTLLPRIGRVHSVRIECQSYLPDWRPGTDYRHSYSARKNTGGVLLDLIHEIDYAIWIFGRPEKVFAKVQNTGKLDIEAEDTADLLWTSPDRAAISIRLDYITRRTRRRMLAVGEYGTLEWDAIGKNVRLAPHDCDEEVVGIEQVRDDLYRDQAEAFLRAVMGGAPGDLATFEEGADAVALCDAARCSSQSGKEETIRDWRNQ